MKRSTPILVPLFLAMVLPRTGYGDPGLSARLLHKVTLQYEPVMVNVTVQNDAGEIMTIGGPEGNTTLAFVIERRPGYPIDTLARDRPMVETVVAPYGSRTLTVDVSRHYDLRKTGPYNLVAKLRAPGISARSGRMLLDVVPGFVVREISARSEEGGSSRLYSLRTLKRDRGEQLFLRIEDSARKLCYGVYGLGRLVQGDTPLMMDDRAGKIHVLHMSSPSRTTHTISSPEGAPDQLYLSREGTAPRLVRTEDGLVTVIGGSEYRGDVRVKRPVIESFDPFSTE
jgi:hypothetical protein